MSSKKVLDIKFAASRWIKLLNFSEESLEKVKTEWSKIPFFDGFVEDEGDAYVCFTFKQYVPKSEKDAKHAKSLNEKVANKKMRELSNYLKRIGYYFNINRLTIKFLK